MSTEDLMKEAIKRNRLLEEKRRQEMTIKDKIKEWCKKVVIWIFWILIGLYALNEIKNTFFYSLDNPPERVYDPTQRSKQ